MSTLPAPLAAPLFLLGISFASVAHAQTITTTALATTPVPVNNVGALLLLALAISVCIAARQRWGLFAKAQLRAWTMSATALALGAILTWGDAVRAQLAELQRSFTVATGETQQIPVQATALAVDGSPLGFLPVVYTNNTGAQLRISALTPASWQSCFPLGVPAELPTTAPRVGTQCALDEVLVPGSACWIDVAQLCSTAAATVVGNQSSILQADTANAIAGVLVTGNVLTNDSDADGPLQVTRFTLEGNIYAPSVAAAGFTLQSNGTFSFSPPSPYTGASPLVVTYAVQTGSSATLTISINNRPVAANDSATTNESTAVSIAVRGNDTDADGDLLTVTSVTQGTNGSVVIDPITGNPIYSPNPGFVGTDTFSYTVSDGRGGTAAATVAVTVNAVIVNVAPVAVNDSATTDFDTPLVISEATLLANDTDTDLDTLTVQSVQAAVNGTVSRAGGNITFTPTSGFEGSASFTYTITDGTDTSTATVTVAVAGVAAAPSVVVLKSLLVIARGTGGASVPFQITTALVDADGSESLSIRVSGVPTGLTFNAGTNLGGGVWQFVAADLANLALNVPGSYTTLATALTVQVTATESNGGATASSSVIVTLKAAYTTVDITTTESGNYTGSSANEFIQGGNGNNTINASAGNNIVYGGVGDDFLSAGAGSDVLDGGSGRDILNGGSGTDVLIGGPDNDTLTGGDIGENFVDVFLWQLGDQGITGAPAEDMINHFSAAAAGSNTTGGDVLHLRDLLQGEAVGPSNGAGNLANYLHFEISGGNTIIHISHTGGFAGDSHAVGGPFRAAASTQRIVLLGVDLQSFYSGAATDQQIITQLLNNQKLLVN